MKTFKDLLVRHPFWNSISLESRKIMLRCAIVEHFQSGESIFERGAHADYIYFIVEGKVVIESTDEKDQEATSVQTIKAGEVVGWSALYPPYKRAFRAQSLTVVEAVAFAADGIRREMERSPTFGMELYRLIGGSLLGQMKSLRLQLSRAYDVP